MADHRRHHRRAGRPGRAAAAEVPEDQGQSQYGGQKGHMLTMVRKELLAHGLLRRGDRRRRPAGDHDVHQEGDGRRRAGGAGPEARRLGDKELHVAVAARRARHRRAARLLRRPGLPREPAQLGRRRRLAGLGVQAVRARGRHRRRLLPQGHLRAATRPTCSPDGTKVRQRGTARRAATTTARRSACSPRPSSRSTPRTST